MDASIQVLSSIVQAALVCFGFSQFRIFVYRPMRLTMPVCVHFLCLLLLLRLCAPTSIHALWGRDNDREQSAMYLHWLDPVALPVGFNPPPPQTLDPFSKDWLACHVRTRQGVLPGLLTAICENLLLSLLIIPESKVIPHCKADIYQYNQSSNVIKQLAMCLTDDDCFLVIWLWQGKPKHHYVSNF